MSDTCPQCTGPLSIRNDTPPPHFGRYVCSACGKFAGWVRTPLTPERAAAWVMPFGKHRGLTLAEIGETDIGYLTWLVANVDRPSIQRTVRYFLDQAVAHKVDS